MSSDIKPRKQENLWKRQRRNPVRIATRKEGYERIDNTHRGKTDGCYLHQLLAIADGADPYKIFSGEYHTHHKNEIKWDNRSENLEVLHCVDHGIHHAEKTNLGDENIYTREEMLSWIDLFVEELGFVPTQKDLRGWPGPSGKTYVNRFGSWKKAILDAGYTPRGGSE